MNGSRPDGETAPVALALEPGDVRVAVVGAGPAGFYTAAHLLDNTSLTAWVDMFERLPTPFGLVRAGVAPDHPRIKSVTRLFDKIAQRDRFRFFGNVEIGCDIGVFELENWYDAVIYAIGAPAGARVEVPGAALPGNYSAAEFVGWYNGHPEYADLDIDLDAERAVVIGNGNVALDVARILLKGKEELAATDIADHALAALTHSRIREVLVLGRRGPRQASFTAPELIELGGLFGVEVGVDPADLAAGPTPSGEQQRPRASANLEILSDYARRQPTRSDKRLDLRFRTSPAAIVGHDRVRAIDLVRSAPATGAAHGAHTPVTRISAGLIVHAVGYRHRAIPGLPVDTRTGGIAHRNGRIVTASGTRPGQYVAGWAKRGPSGVIGTNKACAKDTVDILLADLHAGRLAWRGHHRPADIAATMTARDRHCVDYPGWERIDQYERAAGQAQGRPRVKVVRLPELLELTDQIDELGSVHGRREP